MSTPINHAAVLNEVNQPLVVETMPYPEILADDRIIVKAKAWSINPVDCFMQKQLLWPWLTTPLVLGCDIAGEVVEVGPAVKGIKKGDRVASLASGFDDHRCDRFAFQEYVECFSVLAVKLPDTMSFHEGVVFPLTLCTAASGLFDKEFLALDFPKIDAKPNGKTLLVWGGASAVGANAIQLAVAAGYDVITTCSPKNFEFVKSLGASKAFDYKSETVEEEIVKEIDSCSDFAGAYLAAGADNTPMFRISQSSTKEFFIASATLLSAEVPEGVNTKFVWGSSLKDNESGPYLFSEFLPKALANGSYKVAPEPLVVGKGLESIQTGLDTAIKGMSARKVVVTRT